MYCSCFIYIYICLISKLYIIFNILQLLTIQCGVWQSVHIDDIYPEDSRMPKIQDLQKRTLSEIFISHAKKTIPMPEIERYCQCCVAFVVTNAMFHKVTYWKQECIISVKAYICIHTCIRLRWATCYY